MNDIAFLSLTNGGFVVVDAHRFEEINSYTWCRTKKGYILGSGGGVEINGFPLTSFVNRTPYGFLTDHINGDLRDYTERNLRTVNDAQNRMNSKKQRIGSSSRYKGVHFHTGLSQNNWVARITVDGKQISLGAFKSELVAAISYDAAAIEHFGKYAKLNFSR